MKGIKWNGDYFAEKGMCSSDSKEMFSVGGLVAFQTEYHSSPDGRQHHSGCDLSSASYFLQEEITLEEFDKTEVSRFNSGSYDIQTVIELKDVFCHEKSSSSYGTKQFLCSILDHNNFLLPKEIASARIEEVRNHPGKFLHIYLVGDGPFKIAEQAASFEDAVASINNTFDSLRIEMNYLEKAAAEKHALGMKFTEEGVRLAILRAKKSYGDDSYWSESFKDGKVSQLESLLSVVDDLNNANAIAIVSTSAYYSKPSYRFVNSDSDIPVLSLGTDDHFGHAVRDSDLVIKKIAKKVKLSDGRIYCGSFRDSTLIDVFKEQSGETNYDTNLYTSWCDSQSWNESVHDYSFTRFEIETGEEGKMVEYNNHAKEQKKARTEKFNDLSQKIAARFGEDILKLILKEKGRVISLMATIEEKADITQEDIKLALEAGHGKSSPIPEILIKIITDRPDQHKVRKVVAKASAWAYLSNAKLAYVAGKKCYFDDTMAALEIYRDMKLPNTPDKYETLTDGGLVVTYGADCESDLASKLRDALNEKK